MHFILEENDDVIMISQASDNEVSDNGSDNGSDGSNTESDNETSGNELTDTIRFHDTSDNGSDELNGSDNGDADTFDIESGDLLPYITGIFGTLLLSALARFVL